MIFYTVQHKSYIQKITSKGSIKPDYSAEMKDLNAIPDSVINTIIKESSTVPPDVWKQKIPIYLKYQESACSKLSCYYQNRAFQFYINPKNPRTYKIYLSKELVLLKVKNFYKYGQNDDGSQLLFTAYNNFYYISNVMDSAFGPFIINDVSSSRYPIHFISHSYQPYDILEFQIDGNQSRNKILFIPEKHFLVEHYEIFQEHFIDSLAKQHLPKQISKASGNTQLIVFALLVTVSIVFYLIQRRKI